MSATIERLKFLKAIADAKNRDIAQELNCSLTQIGLAINDPVRYPLKFRQTYDVLWEKALTNEKALDDAIALVEELKREKLKESASKMRIA